MVHCSPHEHCNRGNAAILAIQGSGNKNNVGQDKSFWAGAVDCTIACPSQTENEDLSAALHMYFFTLPNLILPSWWARTVRRSGNQGIGAQQLHSQNTFVLPTTTDISLVVDLQFAFSNADPPFAGCQLFQTIHQSCQSGRSYFYHRLSGRSCLLFASVCVLSICCGGHNKCSFI